MIEQNDGSTQLKEFIQKSLGDQASRVMERVDREQKRVEEKQSRNQQKFIDDQKDRYDRMFGVNLSNEE